MLIQCLCNHPLWQNQTAIFWYSLKRRTVLKKNSAPIIEGVATLFSPISWDVLVCGGCNNTDYCLWVFQTGGSAVLESYEEIIIKLQQKSIVGGFCERVQRFSICHGVIGDQNNLRTFRGVLWFRKAQDIWSLNYKSNEQIFRNNEQILVKFRILIKLFSFLLTETYTWISTPDYKLFAFLTSYPLRHTSYSDWVTYGIDTAA